MPADMVFNPATGNLIVVDPFVDGKEFDGTTGAFIGDFAFGGLSKPRGVAAGSIIFAHEGFDLNLPQNLLALLDDGTVVIIHSPPAGALLEHLVVGPPQQIDQVDLVIDKQGPGTASPGQQITYDITITNTSGAGGTNLNLTESLPDGVTFVSASVPCDQDATVGLACSLGDLAAGASTTMQVTVTVDAGVAVGTQISNAAIVLGAEPDPDLLSNSDAAVTTVVAVTVVVPDVVELLQSDAEHEIQARGFTVGTITKDFSNTVPAGKVISQTPPGGSPAAVGSSVDLLVSLGPPGFMIGGSWGRLPTNDPRSSGDNAWIADYEIARWIDQSFEDGSKGDGTVSSNMIMLFTTCYGGSFLENFNDTTGEIQGGTRFDNVSFTNTTGLSNVEALVYGVGSAIGMRAHAVPDATAQEVHQAGIDSAFTGEVVDPLDPQRRTVFVDEKPQIRGDSFRGFGGATSTHILAWAGDPEKNDRDAIQDILQNWVVHPDTTITILAGHDPPSSSTIQGTPVKRGPATRGNLQQAIQDIGALMDDGADEQFIFISLDHGNIFPRPFLPPPPVPAATNPPGTASETIPVRDTVLEVVRLEREAEPRLTVALDNVDLSPGEFFDLGFDVNGCSLGVLSDVVGTKRQVNLPTGVTTHEYSFALPRECLNFPDGPTDPNQPVDIEQSINITNAMPFPIQLNFIGLSMGSCGGAVFVPDVVGLTQANAEAEIIEADLAVGSISTATSNTVPAGAVIEQSPAESSAVPLRTTVDLKVAAPASIDPFLCYKGRTTKKTPKFKRRIVALADQFEAGDFKVIRPVRLCNPVNKNGEGITDPAAHLVGYRIKPAKWEPKHVRQTNILVENQIGTIVVDTVKPHHLLVPSTKSLTGEVNPPLDPPIDHFKCYRVKVTKGTPKFPRNNQVSLVDQFTEPTSKVFDVRRPKWLCTPVDKNGEGIKNLDTHLMCYKMKPAKGEPAHIPVLGIHVNNQFDAWQLNTVKEKELCVPSTKIIQ